VYTIPIIVTYFGDTASEPAFVKVPVNGYVNFSIQALWGTTSHPLSASPGSSSLPLTFIIKDVGLVDATNVTLNIVNSYPLLVSQKSIGIGIIPAGEYNEGSITASVYSNITPGTYFIPIKVNYFGDTSLTEYVPIIISGPKLAVNLVTIPPQIFPGFYDIRLEGVVVNYGTGIAENTSVSISVQPPLELISPNNISLGAIATGGVVNSTFLINVHNNTPAGSYTVYITVNYDGGSLMKPFSVKVYPKAYLDIVGVHYSSLTSGASQVPITLTIKNEGNATAYNVRAILGQSDVIYPYVSSSNPLSALTASESSLGDISPGQEVNVTYIIDVSSGASSGIYPMSVTLVWNQTGSLIPFAQSDSFNVMVSPPLLSQIGKDFSNPITIIIIVVLAIIIIVLALVALRRRKK
ncbi:COG1361 S-layer family protein, partial [Acidianus sp. RZ1]|nr:hypothetical protein [Acidianus sp. RZ1]